MGREEVGRLWIRVERVELSMFGRLLCFECSGALGLGLGLEIPGWSLA